MNTQQMKLYSNNEYAISKKFQLSLVFIFGMLFLLTSNLAFMSQAEAANCGGLNQKGCKLKPSNKFKACNKGLHLKLKTKRCVRNKVFKPKQKNCGKLGQRACKITPTRLKACNLHLVRDKKTGKCRKIKSIIPPKQKNCGKIGQYACKVTPTRLKACNFGLVKDKNTKRCRKMKSIIPPKQQNCGKYRQYACKITPLRLKACDLGLVKDKYTKRCRKMKSIIPPKQQNCGKLGQYACKITPTRLKACDLHLKKDKQTKRCRKLKSIIPPKQQNCGKLGQRACKVTPFRLKACDFSLHRDKNTRMCVRNKVNALTIISTAKNVANESAGLIRVMKSGLDCFMFKSSWIIGAAKNTLTGKKREQSILKDLKRAINNRDTDAAMRLTNTECFKDVINVAVDEGYQTITVGVSSGGSAVVGGFLDTGFAYDIRALHRFINKRTKSLPLPKAYQAKGLSVGVQAGGGNSLSMGLSKSRIKANVRGSRTHGATLALATVAGAAAGVWFDYDGQLDGITAAITGGVEFEAAYNKLNTSTYNLDKPYKISNCGGKYKPACNKWERSKACDKGLKHNLINGRCEPRKNTVPIKPYPGMNLLNCGANGQRVCSIQEQVPGCNSGLKIDFNIKRCVYK